MLELVLVDGATRGIVIRDLVSGRIYSHAADAVVLASGGYGSLFGYTARQRRSSIGGTWCAWSKGAFFANPEAPQRVPSLYSPGGLWVDYNLMSNLPGLFVIGEANFSDHGWSQLPHNSQLQALADGYFILPITIGHYLAQQGPYGSEDSTGEFKKAESQVHGKLKRLLSVQGKQSVSSVQEKLGRILRESVGISAGKDILEQAVQQVKGLQNTFWTDISVPGDHQSLNPSLQRAIHVANLLDLADLVLVHALARYGPGPASIDAPPHVAAWEHTTHGPRLHIETLHFDHRPQRSESP
jgi:succinate dehydrogenase / fumarate reductase flavoprotein subunit